MFCQSCGHDNTDDCIFCVSCGANINEQMDEETIKVTRTSYSEEQSIKVTRTSYSKETGNSDSREKGISDSVEEEKEPPLSDFSDSSGYKTVTTNPLAAAGLVVGILALCSCCGMWIPFLGYGCFFIFPLLSLLGLILGIAGKIQIARSEGTQKGNDIAIIGIIMNGLWIFLFILYMLLMVFGVVAATTLPMIMEKFK